MYRTYNARPLPRTRSRGRSFRPLAFILLTLILIAIYCLFALLRPLPAPRVVITPPVLPALVRVNLPWPTAVPQEQSAFGAVDYGLLAQSRENESPLPMASVAKVITSLAILEKKPLKLGEQGPPITLSAHDADLYNQYVAKDGSVVPVAAGEMISEYQALQAIMLPSANNIADTLSEWAFGSLAAYDAYANEYVKKLGMKQTTVADASGFSPQTVSTASDLILLGQAAMKHPVLAQIAAQQSAIFPGYGPMQNVNGLLGTAGIRGIKTGNTEEAGGCFLGAADQIIDGKKITVITAIMGAPNLGAALKSTLPLVQTTPSLFDTVHVVRPGQNVGRITTEWGDSTAIIAEDEMSVLSWSGTAVAPRTIQQNVSPTAKAGSEAGNFMLTANGTSLSSDLKLADDIDPPSAIWRLRHPM